MTEDERTGYVIYGRTGRRRRLFRRRPRRRKMRWLRLLAVVVPLAFLALISFVFGMVVAVTPQLDSLVKDLQVKFDSKNGVNTLVFSDAASGRQQIATLTSHDNQFFLDPDRVPAVMAHAIVAVEDKRFYTESGVDFRGIARAFVADIFGGSGTQGASTIAEQFIKIAENQQSHRTILEKLKEAALAFQLSHHWHKQKILAEYLNSAYYGSGAYSLEAAAKAYFGNDPSSNLYKCGTQPRNSDPASLCVTYLTADEAALLAAAVREPSDFNGLQDATLAEGRRNLVLDDMTQQGYLTASEAAIAKQTSLPSPEYVESPAQESTNSSDGYFTSWITGQLEHHLSYGERIFSGGYRVYTTLDANLQNAAQSAVDTILPAGIGGPAAAVVAIQNDDAEVRAMVGGYNYNKSAFNLATQAERQPGSAFKAFDLAAALESGDFNASTPVLSAPFTYPASGPYSQGLGAWEVHNDETSYADAHIPLSEALAVSDNSVFARVGLSSHVGPYRIADVAHQFGITTTISLNPSMVIGGLHEGVTPLDMAHAYETIANGGRLTSGTLTSYHCAGGATHGYTWEGTVPKGETCPGAVGIDAITGPDGNTRRNQVKTTPVYGYSYSDDQTEINMLRGVLGPIGTAASAAIPGVKAWGKTGTTSNYEDAWFVGSIPKIGNVPSMTIAVWVGYPNKAKPMKKNFGGKPVYGGTFPAEIWRSFVEQMLSTYHDRAAGIKVLAPRNSNSTHASTGTTSATTPATGATTTTGTTTITGTTSAGGAPTGGTTSAAGATGTTTPTTALTTPTTGTTAPTTGTTAPSTGTTTPVTNGPTTTPPPTNSSGGVSAPTAGTTGAT